MQNLLSLKVCYNVAAHLLTLPGLKTRNTYTCTPECSSIKEVVLKSNSDNTEQSITFNVALNHNYRLKGILHFCAFFGLEGDSSTIQELLFNVQHHTLR